MESVRKGPLGQRWEWLVWVLAYGALRLLLVASFCDVFVYGEELEKAAAGKALLDGVPIPTHLLPYHPYEGGGFVVSALDALAFSALGESVLAIKLVALALGAATLWVGWSLCERFGDRSSARAFALLFVFAPESVQANSVLALGIHYHACLFIGLVLSLALRAAFSRAARDGAWVALGVAAGFGFYFSYQLALTLLVVGTLLVLAYRRELFGRRLAWALAGALIGITPLLWMALHHGGGVFDIHGASLVGGDVSKLDLLSKFSDSLTAGRGAFDLAALVLLVGTPLAALTALRGCESRTFRWVVLAITAHVVLFLAAYLAGGFTIGRVLHFFYLHRLMPLWFLAILLCALAVSRRRWLWSPIVALAVLGALDTFRMVRDAQPESLAQNLSQLAEEKGYRYSQYLQKIEPRLPGTRAEKLSVLLAFDEPQPELLHEALAIALYGSGEGSFESMCEEIRSAGVSDLRGFELGMGLMLMRHKGRDFQERIDVVAGFDAPTRDALIEGIGRFGQWELGTEDTVLREAKLGVDAGFPEPFFVGLGRRLHSALGDARVTHYFERHSSPAFLSRAKGEHLIAEAPESARGLLRAGYEHARLLHELP
jgi:hypothetical protein